MIKSTKNKPVFTVTIALLVLFVSGIYSCNNSAGDEKKAADSTVVVDTVKAAMDTTHPKTDTIKETKVPAAPKE